MLGSPDYVLASPYNSYFTNPVFPRGESRNVNAMNAFNALFANGTHGVLAQIDGITLLQEHYLGTIAFFLPFEENFTFSSLHVPFGVKVVNQSGTSYLENLTGGTVWFGPYIKLPPGSYTL